jgi:Skp family chaperone for outer membrane proteins
MPLRFVEDIRFPVKHFGKAAESGSPARVKEENNQQGALAVRILTTTVLVAVLVLGVTFVAMGQSASPPAGTRVAVIDISSVFKNHESFKSQMEGMKKDVQAFEGELRERGKEIESIREQLIGLKVGSVDYKGKEKLMAQRQADGQVETQVKRREFLQRESQIYFATYMQISEEIARFAQRNGISMVVRFNSGEIDPDNRKSVMEGVNRPVVYQQNLNITKNIVALVNRASVAGANQGDRTPR